MHTKGNTETGGMGTGIAKVLHNQHAPYMLSFTCQSNPANPANPANPTKPANPARPANPTKPANPAMPANPAKAPVHPVNIPMPIIILSPITRQSMHASPPPSPFTHAQLLSYVSEPSLPRPSTLVVNTHLKQ